MTSTAVHLPDTAASPATARRADRVGLLLGGPCALVVAVLTGLAVLHAAGVPAVSSWRFDAEADRTLMEWAGSGWVLLAAALLLRPGRRTGQRLLLAWAGVLVAVALDDLLMLHERAGAALAAALPLPTPLGLRDLDVGELLAWGALGATSALVLLLAHRTSDRWTRAQARPLLHLLAALVVVAVGLDLAHSAVADAVPRPVDLGLGVLEATAELAVAAALLVRSAVVALRDRERASGEAPAR